MTDFGDFASLFQDQSVEESSNPKGDSFDEFTKARDHFKITFLTNTEILNSFNSESHKKLKRIILKTNVEIQSSTLSSCLMHRDRLKK